MERIISQLRCNKVELENRTLHDVYIVGEIPRVEVNKTLPPRLKTSKVKSIKDSVSNGQRLAFIGFDDDRNTVLKQYTDINIVIEEDATGDKGDTR